ncbi:MAG TPA: LptF/LptG family permease [Opitutaceae bacterium]
MHLLHRHIFWGVLGTCGAAVGLFAFVLIVGNALKDLLGYVATGQIPPETFAKLLLLLVPYVCAYALPMGVLTGVLLVLGRMSAQQEITAMRAAGLSLGYIARPIFVLGTLGVVAGLGVNFYYMPLARTAYKQTLADAVQKNPLSFIVPKTFIRDFPGIVVYVGEKDGALLRDFWVWELDSRKRVRTFARAQTGRFDYDAEQNKLTLTLANVTAETRDENDPENFSKPLSTGSFGEVPIELKLSTIFGKQELRKKASWLTLEQLEAEQARLEAENAPVAERLKISSALHEKASSAFAVLAFAIVAVPLGIKVSRKETSANLGVALGLLLGYLFLTNVIGSLDQFPQIRPDLLLWLPSALFFALGVWLFRRLGRV